MGSPGVEVASHLHPLGKSHSHSTTRSPTRPVAEAWFQPLGRYGQFILISLDIHDIPKEAHWAHDSQFTDEVFPDSHFTNKEMMSSGSYYKQEAGLKLFFLILVCYGTNSLYHT